MILGVEDVSIPVQSGLQSRHMSGWWVGLLQEWPGSGSLVAFLDVVVVRPAWVEFGPCGLASAGRWRPNPGGFQTGGQNAFRPVRSLRKVPRRGSVAVTSEHPVSQKRNEHP